MNKKLIKIMLVGLLCVGFFINNALALPSEWGVVNPSDLAATESEMLTVMQNYWETEGTGPAYFLWTGDESRMTWTLAWTGGYGQSTDKFGGLIALENAFTNDFLTLSWDSDDLVLDENDSGIEFYARAWNYFDGITFTITDYDLPSYVGFDLRYNLQAADPNHIFLGASMETIASLGEDQDFAVAAPVPEPATMLLLGAGLIGLAGVGRKKLKKG